MAQEESPEEVSRKATRIVSFLFKNWHFLVGVFTLTMAGYNQYERLLKIEEKEPMLIKQVYNDSIRINKLESLQKTDSTCIMNLYKYKQPYNTYGDY